MSQTIKRKARSARRTAASQGKARKVRSARAKTGSALDTVMAWLPFNEEQLHRIFMAMIIGVAAALTWAVASMAGVPAMAGYQIASLASDSGFEVRRVDVRGVKRLNELKVYERVLAERDRAMPMVDIHALRDSLLELSWVKDARVSRQLPDTLVVDIVEREPFAVLRKRGSLVLIDQDGHELEAIKGDAVGTRLIVAGEGAGGQVKALMSLIDAAPALKPRVREAEWVGSRRWDLTFRTGQVLELPEGAREAATAFKTFAHLDGTNRLLGGKAVAFDMRASDRVYFRIPGRASEEAAVRAGAIRRKETE